GVHVLELLAGEPEAHVVHPRPAELLRDADAQELELRHLGEEAPLEAMLAVEVVDLGSDLAPRPVAHRLLDRLLLFRQLEIDHRPAFIAARPGRPVARSTDAEACAAAPRVPRLVPAAPAPGFGPLNGPSRRASSSP